MKDPGTRKEFQESREAMADRAVETTALVKLDAASRMLAEVKDAADAKRVMDTASALKYYAKKQGLGRDAIEYAQSIQIDAQAMLGSFLKAGPKNPGTRTKGGGSGAGGAIAEPPANIPTIEALGITKKESAASRFLATVRKKRPADFKKVRAGEKTVLQLKREEKERGRERRRKENEKLLDAQKEIERLKAELATWKAGLTVKRR